MADGDNTESDNKQLAERPTRHSKQPNVGVGLLSPDVQPAHVDGRVDSPGLEVGGSDSPPLYPYSLLGDASLNDRGNAPVRIALMLQVQRTYGNHALRRYLQKASAQAPSSYDTQSTSSARETWGAVLQTRLSSAWQRFVQRTSAPPDEKRPEEHHRVANAITGHFESGKTDGLNTTDAGIISYGKHQATLKSGSLTLIVRDYIIRSKSDTAQQLATYLGKLNDKKHRAVLKNDEVFLSLLKVAASEPEMSQAQDSVFTTQYWNPSEKKVASAGAQSALAHAIFYDTIVQGGSDPKNPASLSFVLNATKEQLGGTVGDIVKGKQITEQEFLRAFLQKRKEGLEDISAKNKAEAEEKREKANDLDEQAAAANPRRAKKLRVKARALQKVADRKKQNASDLATAANSSRIPKLLHLVDSNDLGLHGDAKGRIHLTSSRRSGIRGINRE